MLCSVIIPARNASRVIGACILAVLSQTLPRESYEVIVVDDGSADRTAGVARQLGARLVPQPPFGIAAARNTGARVAKGEFLVFLDPDGVPQIDWLERMIAPFRDAEVVGVTGAYETHDETLVPRVIQAQHDDTYRRRGATGATPVVEGYSAAYRKSVFVAAGGFDPSLAAADDVELSYRLAKRGRLVFAPDAIVLHQHDRTLGRYVERSLRDGLWRSLVYARHPRRLLGEPGASLAERGQVPLAGLAVVSAVAGTRAPSAFRLTGLALAAFLATTIPAAWRARRAGADVALAAPGLSFARSAATSVGLLVGGAAVLAQKASNLAGEIGRDRRNF